MFQLGPKENLSGNMSILLFDKSVQEYEYEIFATGHTQPVTINQYNKTELMTKGGNSNQLEVNVEESD